MGSARVSTRTGPRVKPWLRTASFTNIVQDGKLLPAALAAKRRGVIFDVGHGGGSFDYTVAEAAIQQAERCPPGNSVTGGAAWQRS